MLHLLPLLAGSGTGSAWWVLPVILGFFILLVGAIILVKRHVKVFKNEEKPKTKEEIAQEELDRLLVPIEEQPEAKPEEEEEKPEEPEEK